MWLALLLVLGGNSKVVAGIRKARMVANHLDVYGPPIMHTCPAMLSGYQMAPAPLVTKLYLLPSSPLMIPFIPTVQYQSV